MICPKCQFEQSNNSGECIRCGIIFEKYQKRSIVTPSEWSDIQKEDSRGQDNQAAGKACILLKEVFLYTETGINPFYFAGRVIVYIGIFIWGWMFVFKSIESNYVGKSFMHLINLPFHEAGHVFFRPFGQFMMMLGGSLGQLLIPFVCFIFFIIKTRDTFAASITLWWLGQSLLDLAPYINDARALKLMLIGGVTGRDVPNYHDWEFILRKLGWLHYDHTLALTVKTAGTLLIFITFVWAGYLLFRQYKNIDLS
jgi:hypothetical protein